MSVGKKEVGLTIMSEKITDRGPVLHMELCYTAPQISIKLLQFITVDWPTVQPPDNWRE